MIKYPKLHRPKIGKITVAPMHFCLPETFVDDLKARLDACPPPFKVQHIDELLYVIHTVISITRRTPDDDLKESNWHVPVSKVILKEWVNQYRPILNYLVEQGFIEENKSYQVGRKCGTICLQLNYYTQSLVRIPVGKKSFLKRHTARFSNSNIKPYQKRREKAVEQYNYITKWLPFLEVDYNRAMEIHRRLWHETVATCMDEDLILKKFKSNSQKLLLREIAEKDYSHLLVDDTGHRLHTPLTSLKSDYRCTVTFKGKRLVSLDIKSSQLYLLLAFFNPQCKYLDILLSDVLEFNPFFMDGKKHTTKDIFEEALSELNNINTTKETKKLTPSGFATIMLGKWQQFIGQTIENEDIKAYVEDVCTGQFYATIQWAISGTTPETLDEALAKEQGKDFCMKALFGRNSTVKKFQELQAFWRAFPSIYRVVECIKAGPEGEDTHCALPCTLQRLEARLILDTCCRIIATERPRLPIYTLHDSIITTEGDEEYIRSVMERVLTEAIGFTPAIKVSKWA